MLLVQSSQPAVPALALYLPLAHAVHEVWRAADVYLPAAQSMHLVAPCWSSNLPAPQSLQLLPEVYLPGAHAAAATQVLSDVGEHATATVFPVAHDEQAMHLFGCPRLGRYVPAEQARHF